MIQEVKEMLIAASVNFEIISSKPSNLQKKAELCVPAKGIHFQNLL
jgi:hypothetical protein